MLFRSEMIVSATRSDLAMSALLESEEWFIKTFKGVRFVDKDKLEVAAKMLSTNPEIVYFYYRNLLARGVQLPFLVIDEELELLATAIDQD